MANVVVYLVPPEHSKSLKGSLAKYAKTKVPTGAEWESARNTAWAAAAKAKTGLQKGAA